jgi:cell division protein FtsW
MEIDMEKDRVNSEFDEISEAQAGARIDAVPNWERRELSSEYIDAGQRRPGFDVPFFVITLVILLIGIIMVLSASFARSYFLSGEPMRLFFRQLVFAVSGVSLMLVVSRVSVRTMSRFTHLLLLFSISLLVLVLFVGISVNNARRWLGIGELSFQPSEIAKLAVIMSFAQMICRYGRKRMGTFKYGVFPFAAITVIIVALLIREPHYSAAIIIVSISAIMMFAGGTRLRWFLLAGFAFAAMVGIILVTTLWASDKEVTFDSATEQLTQIQWGDRLGYAGRRIDAWLDPDADPLGDGFQIRQSLIAVGSGGLLGQGLGQSRQKYLYLPEEHNDYIFAIVSEELGFIGSMLILLLFVLLVIRGFWLALHAKDQFSSLITIGITSLLAIQVFLNVAVVTNLVPATGISLPFFSYGGTALWIQLVQMGIILAVSREIPLTKMLRESAE